MGFFSLLFSFNVFFFFMLEYRFFMCSQAYAFAHIVYFYVNTSLHFLTAILSSKNWSQFWLFDYIWLKVFHFLFKLLWTYGKKKKRNIEAERNVVFLFSTKVIIIIEFFFLYFSSSSSFFFGNLHSTKKSMQFEITLFYFVGTISSFINSVMWYVCWSSSRLFCEKKIWEIISNQILRHQSIETSLICFANVWKKKLFHNCISFLNSVSVSIYQWIMRCLYVRYSYFLQIDDLSFQLIAFCV